jgi:hypothetical protein
LVLFRFRASNSLAQGRRRAEFTPAAVPAQLKLFAPSTGIEYQRWNRGEGAEPSFVTPDAPDGGVIDYRLPKRLRAGKAGKALHQTAVRIEIRDARGQLSAARYGPSRFGLDRYVGNMRYERPTRRDFEQLPLLGTPARACGAAGNRCGQRECRRTDRGRDRPCRRRPESAAGPGRSAQRPAARPHSPRPGGRAEPHAEPDQRHASAARSLLQHGRVGGERHRSRSAETGAGRGGLVARGESLGTALDRLTDSIDTRKVQHTVLEDNLHPLTDLHDALEMNASRLAGPAVQAPTAPRVAIAKELTCELDAKLTEYNGLLAGRVAAYNRVAYAAGFPTLGGGKPITPAAAALVH